MKQNYGFTLVEVIVVTLIIGILASIAIPSYKSHLAKGQRAQAKSELMRVAMTQEQWRATRPYYAGDGDIPVKNTENHIVNIASADAVSFVVTATPINPDSCGVIRITETTTITADSCTSP